MSTLIDTTSSTQDKANTLGLTPNLRTHSADAASGFAQVLQAFSPKEQSELVQSSSDDDALAGSEVESREVDEQSEGSEEQNQRTDENGSAHSNPNGSDQTQGEGEDPSASAQGEQIETEQVGPDGANTPQIDQSQVRGEVDQAAEQPNAQQVSKELSGLDLLNNKSDQAKLSIRGFVRAIRADASVDSTTLAVQTRLGQQAQSTGNAQPHPTDQVDPIETRPTNQFGAQSERDPHDALSDTPPQTDRTKGDTNRVANLPGTQPIAAKETPVEPARPETQIARSTRVDAVTQTQSTKLPTETIRNDIAHTIARAEIANRPDGALTARSVTGVETGNTKQGVENYASRLEQSAKPAPSDQTLQSKLIAQVQRGLASLMRSATGEMTLRLAPERLGELKIEIKRSGEQLAVRLTTQNAEASELLRAGSDELTQLLRTKGVDLERLEVDQQPTPQGQYQSSDSQQHPHQDQSNSGEGHQHTNHHSSSAQAMIEETEPTDEIWTELGLDAIA